MDEGQVLPLSFGKFDGWARGDRHGAQFLIDCLQRTEGDVDEHTIHRGAQRGRTHAVARVDRRRSRPGAPGQTRADSARGRARPRRCGGRIDGGRGHLDGVSHQAPVRRRGHGGGVERSSPRWGESQAHRARRAVAESFITRNDRPSPSPAIASRSAAIAGERCASSRRTSASCPRSPASIARRERPEP